jgi:hypothetical protein
VVSNVPQSCGTEHGVDDGVHQNIGVRMTGQSSVAGNLNPTEHQSSPALKPMGVKANADHYEEYYLLLANSQRKTGRGMGL